MIATGKSEVKLKNLSSGITRAMLESERRGKDSSGVLSITNKEVVVAKSPNRAKFLLRSDQFKQVVQTAEGNFNKNQTFAFFGHTRMATHGSAQSEADNQPVIKNQQIALHNGIIINCNQIFTEDPKLLRDYDVDTEAFISLVGECSKNGLSQYRAVLEAFSKCKGANTLVYFTLESRYLYIITSNGSLYFASDNSLGIFVFASEKQTLANLLDHLEFNGIEIPIQQLSKNYALIVDLESGEIQPEHKAEDSKFENLELSRTLRIIPNSESSRLDAAKLPQSNSAFKSLEQFYDKLVQPSQITRCINCLLPTSYPFLVFNDQGICSFCFNYLPFVPKGLEDLKKEVYNSSDLRFLVPISGGRDSCYALHLASQELGLNSVAFTYDWGFVTDVARRNISRMCGELGIEHILVAADLKKKRTNVRMNVEAWLKKPKLGMIPLFMAGDKTFFHHASQIRKELDLSASLFGMNRFEPAGFKTGFAGIDETKIYANTFGISKMNKLKLLAFYSTQSIVNPSYLNSSLVDSMAGLYSYYFKKIDYLQVFDFIPWKENEVIESLQKHYGWESSTESKSTWRIGDASAPFYNYLYLYFAGFTENDVYLSNLIREGQISRQQALIRLQEDNLPNAIGFYRYCELIGLDPRTVLNRIHEFKGFVDLVN
jgi:glucosamine--fructose-6-phosphate aminotransferase (isomerizing)